jgi:hypothetical protein
MTELIWEGKHKNEKKSTPVRIDLPFQTIETLNESVQQRQKILDFFAKFLRKNLGDSILKHLKN